MDNPSTQIRRVRPISPDRTEVTVYCIAHVGEDDEARAARLRKFEDFLQNLAEIWRRADGPREGLHRVSVIRRFIVFLPFVSAFFCNLIDNFIRFVSC